MKKISLLLVTGIISCWIPFVSAQTDTTITENFDGNSSKFIASPASAWKIDNNYYVSSHNSIRGVVLNMTGDETTLTSPVYDLSNYNYVLLCFSHICKVSPQDITRIEYKLQGTGWQTIPASSYMGKSINYLSNGFNANSYTEWKVNDSLALPMQSWWREEVFDIGPDVGGDGEVQFRFVLKHGNTLGTQISYGWIIDNVEIIADTHEIKLPVVEFIAPLVKDTIYSTGPWEINAKVKSTTITQIENPWLVYTTTNNQGTISDSVLMTMVQGDSLWKATIPQFVPGTKVDYFITGRDITGNMADITSGYTIAKPDRNYGNTSAALTKIISPVRGQTMGNTTTPVEVMLRNMGDSVLTSATIYWSVNGVIKQSYSWTGNLLWDFEQQVTIGTYIPRMEDFDNIQIWVEMPNGVPDIVLSDDTVSVTTYGCSSMSGIYTVGQGETFTTLTEALTLLNLCSPVGDITFALKSGVYSENCNLSSISNLIGNHTLTITSLIGNKDSVILRPASGVGIFIDNSNNIRIENITIDVASAGTYGIQFTSACSNVVITQCNILGRTTETTAATAYAPIYCYFYTGASIVNNISITHNVLDGGYYGIYLYGGTNQIFSAGVIIDSNTISNQSNYGIYFQYVDFTSCSFNTILSRTINTISPWYGLYMYYSNGTITGNHIKQCTTAITSSYGIYLYNYNYYNTTMAGLVANNEIMLIEGGIGIFTYNNTHADILHNSIYISGSIAANGLYIWDNVNSILVIKNNNIVMEYSESYPIYLSGTINLGRWIIDANNYYAPTYIGYAENAIISLAGWKSIVRTDINSVRILPNFIDSSINLQWKNYSGIECKPLTNIPLDINGQSRIGLTVMGCYHGYVYRVNAMLTNVSQWSGVYTGGSDTVKVQITNTAITNINSATVYWSVNGSTPQPYTWSGSLATEQSAILTLGSVNFILGDNILDIWIDNIGSLQDENLNDDSIHIVYHPCNAALNGVYTIGNTGYFTTISQAIAQLNLCGASGDIIFALQSDTYTEAIDLSNISLGNHTLTFTSAAHNAADVIIETTSTGILLSNSYNIIIKDITINAINGLYGIRMDNVCSNIVIRDCHILTEINATSGYATAIYKTPPIIVNNITISNNIIEGGYNGIYFYGGAAPYTYSTHIIIDSNTITGQSMSGIDAYYTDFTRISANRISGVFTGISLSYVNGDIINNKVSLKLKTGIEGNGMIVYNYNVYNTVAPSPGLIANNEIWLDVPYSATTTQPTVYGIKLDNAYSTVIHNSIYTSGTGAAYGIATFNTGNYLMTIKNNNIRIDGTNSIFLYPLGDYFIERLVYSAPIYLSSIPMQYDIDYNNMYSPARIGNIGGGDNGGNIATIANWQQQIITDKHSISISSEFVDTTSGLELSNYEPFYCPLIPDVNTDIRGSNRMEPTTMGCYEEIAMNADGRLLKILELRGGLVNGQTDSVKVIFLNRGITPLNSVNLGWAVNGIIQTPKECFFDSTLARLESDTVTVGITTYMPDYFNIKVWINSFEGGTLSDGYTKDDTVSATAFVCGNPLTGIVSISDTSSFSTIAAALEGISLCGMGDIIFLLDSGIYEENCDLSNMNNSMAGYTLTTITSKTGNAKDVIIKPVSGAGFTLSNTRDLTLKAITVDVVASMSSAIQFTGPCTNIVIRDCILLTDTTTSSSTISPVFKNYNTGIVDSIFFINNLLDGGYFGIFFYGGTGTGTGQYATHVVFDSNIVSNQYYSGISPMYVDFTSCSYNTILSRTAYPNNTYYWFGLEIRNSNGAVISNRIIQRSNNVTYSYGIYLRYYNYYNTVDIGLIANNEIILNTKTEGDGIYGYYAKSEVLHNSIYITGSGSGYGIYIFNDATNNINIKNNNVVTTSSVAYPVYFSSTGNLNLYDMDYNNLYAPTYTGYYGVGISDMTTWQQTLNKDLHSVNILPSFIDNTVHLQLLDYAGLGCPKNHLMPFDIDGFYRLEMTTMGCYQKMGSYSVNAALSDISGNSGVVLGIKDSVKVILMNTGTTELTKATLKWKWNNIPQQDVIWTGSLLTGNTTTVSLGEITHTTVGYYTIEAWIDNLDALIDEYSGDDTAFVTNYICSSALNGVYQLGSNNADFTTIEEFTDRLSVCGVNGDIVLELQQGTYQGPIYLLNLSNLLGGYRLTLTSITHNAQNVIIESKERGIVLTNDNNIVIKDITIDVTQGTRGVELTGICSNIVIENCIILANLTATTNAYAGIYTSSPDLNGLTVKNCTIQGGYYGIYLYGTSANYCQNIIIDSNIITGQYYYGTYLRYVNLNSVSYNQIMPRSSNHGTQWYGLYFYNIRNGNINPYGNIIGNRIKANNPGIRSNLYGIYVNYMDSALVANNEIYLNSSAATTYGMYMNNSKGVNYIHNSVLLTGTGGTTFRAAQFSVSTSASYSATYKNNIFVANGGTTPYAVYLSAAPSATFAQYNHIDYNNYYSFGNLGYAGSAQADLAAWKSVVPTDINSVSMFPAFADVTTNLKLSDYTNLICPFYPGVTKDMEGYVRAFITTLGAYTGIRASLDLGIEKVICNDTTVIYPQTVPVKIGIINTGSRVNINNAIFGWSLNGELQPSYTWNATNPLAPERTIEISVGTISAGKSSVFDITVWVESVNGSKDSVVWNDTAKILVKIFCSGNNLSVQSIEQLVPDELCPEDYTPLKVKVGNTGTLDYDFATNPTTFSIRVTNPEPYSFDTIISTGAIKQREIATIELTGTFPIVVAGVYDIEVFLNSSVDNIKYDDTARAYYVSGKFGLPIDEDFSSGIPVDFISTGLNTPNTWQVLLQGIGTDTTVLPVFGDSILSFRGSPGSMTTLSTQRLDLSRTLQPSLSFWYFHDTVPCEDYTDVRITIDGGTTYTTLYSLTKYDAVYGWRQYSMDLPIYAVNQCVILVFEAMEKSRSGDITQYIDRIRITAKQDIAVKEVFASEYSVCDLENKELKVVLSNLTDPVLNYTDTLTVTLEVQETGQTFTKTLTSGTISGFSSDTITLTTGFDLAKGAYTFKAYFTSILDVDRDNDTLETSLTINPELNPQLVQVSGNNTCLPGESPIWQEVTLTNTGNMDLFDIELVLQIDTGETGSPAYFTLTEICTDTIRAGNSHTYTFEDSYTVPWNADYYPRIYASLPCSRGLIDITTAIMECVDMTDLSIVSIDNPSTGNDKVGDAIQVRATLHNRSDNKPFTGLNITVLVTNSQGVEMAKFTEVTGSIGISTMANHTFTNTYTVPNDSVYYLTVYINSYENYPQNDTMTITRYTEGVGITPLGAANSFTLGQNIPNPATNSTRIDYSVPEAGEVMFHVHSITGQLLYSKTIETKRGAHSLELNTSTFASGVYFYSMEYKGQRLVKQLIISN